MLKTINGGISPTRGSKHSAAVDLYANEDVVIGAGETVLVPLGVKIDLKKLRESYIQKNKERDEKAGLPPLSKTFENKYFNEEFMQSHQLNLHIRSSMSAKHGLIIANGTGIIDLDYEDEIMICLHNPFNLNGFGIGDYGAVHLPSGQMPFCEIKKGDKIAQISLVEHKTYLMGINTEEKRTGGFGSSGN